MAAEMERESLITEAHNASVTTQRRVRNDLENSLPKPYMPRALKAPDTSHPHGTPGHRHYNLTVLQQHCAFFDQDNNGIVYPWETYMGMRAMGFNVIASVIMAIGINMAMSYPTQPHLGKAKFSPLPPEAVDAKPYWELGKLADSICAFVVFFQLDFSGIKHGSDSGVYDTEGRFVPANLENMFSKYARTVPDKLTIGELWDMTEGNRNAFDPFGWAASKLEWGILYILARDEEGFLSKEAVRRCYDGSLFEYCAKMQAGNDAKMG